MKAYNIGEICRLEKGKQIDTTLLDDTKPYRYINGGIKESGFYHSYNTDGETILVSEGGASCGYVNYVDEKFWCGCHCYKLTDCLVLPKYLYYALKHNQNAIMGIRTGAAMPNIQKSKFSELKLSLDPCSEKQKSVVSSLDTIQSLIVTKQRVNNGLDELIKSRFICQEVA
jgi:type I restriction enzyme S subunit